jgi:hypothetical protein
MQDNILPVKSSRTSFVPERDALSFEDEFKFNIRHSSERGRKDGGEV